MFLLLLFEFGWLLMLHGVQVYSCADFTLISLSAYPPLDILTAYNFVYNPFS
jgi:hypothetical protein